MCETMKTITLVGILERAKELSKSGPYDDDPWAAFEEAIDDAHNLVRKLDAEGFVLLREDGIRFRGDDDGKRNPDWDAVIQGAREEAMKSDPVELLRELAAAWESAFIYAENGQREPANEWCRRALDLKLRIRDAT